MIKVIDWVVNLKSVENVITLGKLLGLLFLFCLPLLSVLFLKTPKIRGMTSLVWNHFLGERSEPHTGAFNRDFVYCWYVVCRSMSVICQINCVG